MQNLLTDKKSVTCYDPSEGTPIARLMFAHGAGGSMDSDLMNRVTRQLTKQGIEVWRFNFPYRQRINETGIKRPPNPLPVLLEHYLNQVLEQPDDLPLFIGGKSMGGRVATLLMSNGISSTDCNHSGKLVNKLYSKVKGVVVLGYPFHPMDKPDKLRIDHFSELTGDCLIVQGERDRLGDRQQVASYSLPKAIKIKFLPDGDHDLKPRKASGFTHEQHLQSASDWIANFIVEHVNECRGSNA